MRRPDQRLPKAFTYCAERREPQPVRVVFGPGRLRPVAGRQGTALARRAPLIADEDQR